MPLFSLPLEGYPQPVEQIPPSAQRFNAPSSDRSSDQSQASADLNRLHQQRQVQTQQRLQTDYSLERRTFL